MGGGGDQVYAVNIVGTMLNALCSQGYEIVPDQPQQQPP